MVHQTTHTIWMLYKNKNGHPCLRVSMHKHSTVPSLLVKTITLLLSMQFSFQLTSDRFLEIYLSTKHSPPACPAGEWKSGAKRLFQGGGRRLFGVLSPSKTNWGLKKSNYCFQRRTGAINLVAPLVSLGRRVDGRHWFPAFAVEAQQGGCHHLQHDQKPLNCHKIWFHLNHRLFVRLLQLEREGHVPVPTFSQYLQIFDTGSENDKSASALSSTSPFNDTLQCFFTIAERIFNSVTSTFTTCWIVVFASQFWHCQFYMQCNVMQCSP